MTPPPSFKGGQGRSSRQVREDARGLVWRFLILLALLGALWGSA